MSGRGGPLGGRGRGGAGSLGLQKWQAEPPGRPNKPGHGIDLRVRIAEGSLRVPRPLEGIAGLTLDATLETGGPTRATIRRLSWRHGPLASELQSLEAEI